MILVLLTISQMIHDPSNEDETAWVSFLFILISDTLPLCSFNDPSIIWVYLPILHILTSPSIPPDTIFWQSFVPEIDVTPWLCESLIANNSFPDWGKNALILPSFQPDKIDLPSTEKNIQKHSSPGTSILNNSYLVFEFHTLISFKLLVANSSEYPDGYAISFIRS